MLRIDVIFSSNQKEMIPPGTFEALEKKKLTKNFVLSIRI